MSKAPYNTTMDLWYGPNSFFGPANTLYAAAIPCRIVPYDNISDIYPPGHFAIAWVTYDGPAANIFGSVLGGLPVNREIRIFPYRGDVIALPSGGAPNYWLTAVERVVIPGRPTYYRLRVCPYPIQP